MGSFGLVCFVSRTLERYWDVSTADVTMITRNERSEDNGAGASMWPDCVSPEVV